MKIEGVNNMKRNIAILIALFLLVIACSKPETDTKVDTGTPDMAGWIEFTSSEGGFAVSTPSKISDTAVALDSDVGPIVMHTFMAKKGNFIYGVSYADYPEGLFENTGVTEILDGASSGAVEKINGTLISEEKINIGDHPGRDIKVASADKKLVMHMRIYLVGNRLFQVSAGYLASDAESPDILRFLKSFRLLENA